MKQPLACALATALLGQALPVLAAPGDDPRILSLAYSQGGLIHIATSPETVQTVLFAPGEKIQSVIISDPGAYQVTVAGSGDSLTLKANGPSALAIVNVRTDQRSYELELVPGGSTNVASVIRFNYALPARAFARPPAASAQMRGFVWRMSGSRALLPVAIRDDGTRVFIEWAKDQAMPAVFAVGAGGTEQMVDGYVRGGVFTIDRVHPELIFRIDKEKASAVRLPRKGGNG